MALIKIQAGKGQHHAGCICVDNIDLQSGACAVVHADGTNNKADGCEYCYAKYLFSKTKYSIKPPITAEYLSKELVRRNKEKLKEEDKSKSVKSIRFGKMTDIWDPSKPEESLATLMSGILACNETNLPCIFITKLLPFRKDIADALLANKDAVLHYSLGDDLLERGAVKLGMNNKNRIKEAKQYHDYGVNTYLRVCVDIVRPMTDNIKDLTNNNIPLLITPLRYSSKELFERSTGLNWEEAKVSKDYTYDRGALRPQIIHPDWKPDKNAFCGVVGERLGCNSCGLWRGKIRWIKE
jgi:hypothetical protein